MTKDERRGSWAQIDINVASGDKDRIGDVRSHLMALAVDRIARATAQDLKRFAEERTIDLGEVQEKKAHLGPRTVTSDVYVGVWIWSGDGTDDLEGMSGNTLVMIQAEDLREALRDAEVTGRNKEWHEEH